mgnify:CR=1 FL=1
MAGAIPKIDRSLVGPPEGVINPTVVLLAVCLTVLAGSVTGHLIGVLPLAASAVLDSIALYAIYTVHHEAVHRTAHRNRVANDLMGRVAGFVEGISFAMFRILHLQHHANTNHPERDPDYVIGRKPRWLLPIWTFVRLTHDNLFMLRRKLWSGRPWDLAEHLLTVGLQVGVAALAVASGRGIEVALLWGLPVAVAGMATELTVAWAVHYPHESEHPLESTRQFRGLLWQVLTLNQSHHLVHHLWARIPWFRYGKAYPVAARAVAEHRERAKG